MCLAVPMEILEIDGSTALVAQGGVSRRVRVDFIENPQLGDYVLVHAGIAIERIRPEEAEETLRILREIAFEIR